MCFTVQLLVEAGGAGPSQTPSTATKAMSSSCGNKCAHQRRSIADQQEVQQGTVASVTQGQHTGCIVSFKGTYRSCQWLLESFDLGSLCWLTFGGKSTDWWEISSRLDYMPKTWFLKEEVSKYMSNN